MHRNCGGFENMFIDILNALVLDDYVDLIDCGDTAIIRMQIDI